VAGLAAVIFWQRRPESRLRRIALRELSVLEKSALDDMLLAHRLEHLLRRYAVARFGRDAVANLAGERWVGFVVAHGGAAWKGEAGANLLCIAYGGTAVADRARWLDGARAFIRGAR
jgi:hypothetical protein